MQKARALLTLSRSVVLQLSSICEAHNAFLNDKRNKYLYIFRLFKFRYGLRWYRKIPNAAFLLAQFRKPV